jgi:uncharacterized repeat protein (TIGR01451 family)
MKMIQNMFHAHQGTRPGNLRPGSQPQTRAAFMRKNLSAISLGVALLSITAFSGLAADAGDVILRGHVPAAVARSQAQPKGRMSADTTIELSVGLPLRNRDELARLITQLSDPANPNYGKYLTPAQFTDRFGPTEQDYQQVIEFARKNGLTVTATPANRMLLNLSGKIGDVEKAFHVSLQRYQHPRENREFFAPNNEPSVPAGLKIQDISGLDNYRRPHPHYKIKPVDKSTTPIQNAAKGTVSDGATPHVGSGPAQQYVGDDFRRAYVPGTSLNGSGQTVALVQFDGYFLNDIIQYENLVGRTNIPLQNVLLDGFSGAPTGLGGEVEVSLDIEMVISMAPALAKIIVYEGDPFNFHPNDVLNQIAIDNSARQVSCSWGWIGGPNFTTDQIFQQMAVQGQTFFNASGDSDAFLPGQVDDPTDFGTPSNNPYITQAGGTTLTMNGAGTSYAAETVWNWGIRFGPANDGIGSSGGISTFYSIPSWQTNINMILPQGSSTHRNIPDVAMTADDVFVIADGGIQYTGVGGTSVAAPLWAGFAALVNQQAAINAHPPVGFINPALYTIAKTTNYTSCFHDITTGNNTWSQSPSLFFAVPGYDLCTGLGTPNGTNLINALVAQSSFVGHISPPPPPYGTNLAALNGGNPNGVWSLFVQDDAPISSGSVSNGWVLSLTTADIVGTVGDLELLMTASNNVVFTGKPVAFVLTVTNYGPSISTNVIVADDLPSNVTVLSTNTTQGSVSRSGSTLVWNIGTLAINAGARLILTMQPLGAGDIFNSALVQAGTPDPNPDEDSAAVTVTVVVPSAQLIPSFVSSNQTFQINVPGPTNPAATVIIQSSTNLASTNWVSVYTNTPPFIFTDPSASNSVSRFYRALLLP